MLACAYPALDRPMILFQDVVASRYFCSPLLLPCHAAGTETANVFGPPQLHLTVRQSERRILSGKLALVSRYFLLTLQMVRLHCPLLFSRPDLRAAMNLIAVLRPFGIHLDGNFGGLVCVFVR